MEKKFHGNALAKLVASIENAYVDSENEIPLLKPADLVKMYSPCQKCKVNYSEWQ